jgi:hypothetical protein
MSRKAVFTPTTAKDSLGRELNPGDLIAYAVGAGRSQVLNFYQIEEIRMKQEMWNWQGKWEKCGKPTGPSIKARYMGGHAWRFGKPKVFSTLFFPEERSLKMPADTVIPAKAKKAYD